MLQFLPLALLVVLAACSDDATAPLENPASLTVEPPAAALQSLSVSVVDVAADVFVLPPVGVESGDPNLCSRTG